MYIILKYKVRGETKSRKLILKVWSFNPLTLSIPRYTVPFEDKQTTQRVPHAKPTRWRFELNAFAFACPRKRKRV